MVGGHLVLAEALAQVAGQALGQPSGVDEHQGGAMLAGQGGEAVVDQVPDIVGHYRTQRHRRHLDGQVARTGMADVDDGAGSLVPNQELRYPLDGALRGRQSDAPQRSSAQGLQTLQAQRQCTWVSPARPDAEPSST